jgi:hypothetical protein
MAAKRRSIASALRASLRRATGSQDVPRRPHHGVTVGVRSISFSHACASASVGKSA